MKTPFFILVTLVLIGAGAGYIFGYSQGANMAVEECTEGMDQISEFWEAQTDEALALADERAIQSDFWESQLDETMDFIDNDLWPQNQDLMRLTADLTFDWRKCEGGDQTMRSACLIDENCSNCLRQRTDEIGPYAVLDGETYDWCVRHALHDKNEWYDLSGYPYYDGCVWDNCACADDDFIEASPESCSQELLDYYKK